MTRQAVLDGFERFVSDAIEQTAAEFSISRALGGVGLIDRVVGDSETFHERFVAPELAGYETDTIAQFEVVLDWVESEEPFDTFRDQILATGPVTDSIRGDLSQERRAEVHDRLLDHHRALGAAVEPLVASPESDFWGCVQTELDQDTATQLVETRFAFTDPLLAHRDAFAMTKTVAVADYAGGFGRLFGGDAIEIDFTDEAFRAMRHAERSVVADAKTAVAEQFQ
jgi:hypothetical protein